MPEKPEVEEENLTRSGGQLSLDEQTLTHDKEHIGKLVRELNKKSKPEEIIVFLKRLPVSIIPDMWRTNIKLSCQNKNLNSGYFWEIFHEDYIELTGELAGAFTVIGTQSGITELKLDIHEDRKKRYNSVSSFRRIGRMRVRGLKRSHFVCKWNLENSNDNLIIDKFIKSYISQTIRTIFRFENSIQNGIVESNSIAVDIFSEERLREFVDNKDEFWNKRHNLIDEQRSRSTDVITADKVLSDCSIAEIMNEVSSRGSEAANYADEIKSVADRVTLMKHAEVFDIRPDDISIKGVNLWLGSNVELKFEDEDMELLSEALKFFKKYWKAKLYCTKDGETLPCSLSTPLSDPHKTKEECGLTFRTWKSTGGHFTTSLGLPPLELK